MTDLTALTEITAPTTDDLVYVVDAPSGAKNPRKCSIANLVDARTKTLTNTTIDADGTGNSITNIENADIKSGAAIDYSKLNLTGLVVNADLAGSIANTKLATNPLVYTNMVTPTASVPFGDQFLTGVKDGVNVTDAATKGQLDIAVASDITLKGSYNATSNVPNLDNSPTAGTILKGDHYVVATAGTFYSEALQVGDSLIATDDDPVEAEWIITNSQMVTPIVTANIADEAVTEGKIYVSNAGNNGEFLSKQSGNNGGLTWATVPAGYNSPTIGSTSIGSGASVPSLAGLTNVTATGTVQGATVTATGALSGLTVASTGALSGTAITGTSLTTGTGAITSGAITSSGIITGTSTVLLAQGALRLNDSNNSNYAGFKAPADVTTSYDLVLPPATTSTTGNVLKMSSTANTLEWGSAGGLGDELTTKLQASTYPAGEQSPATEGSSAVSIFVKTIDANNQGLYIRIKKNATYTDVQIA